MPGVAPSRPFGLAEKLSGAFQSLGNTLCSWKSS